MRSTRSFLWAVAAGAALTSTVLAGSSDAAEAGSQRRSRLDGQPNFRDLGGYRTADGRTVRRGQVYRSGEFAHCTDRDVATLEDLGLRTVVSFLLPEEIEKYGSDRLPEGTRAVPAPISSERATKLTRQAHESIHRGDFDAIPPELNLEFHRMLLDDGKAQYAALLREISDPANRPLAFHCSQGIHRTGTAAAILLSLLGVPWETVRHEYLLSNEYRSEEISQQLHRLRQAVAESQGITTDDVDMTNAEAFFILRGTYIDAARDKILEMYGSMDGYVRTGLGLSDEEIAHLRNELLE